MAETDLQLNESVKGYARLPYSIYKRQYGGRALRRSEILLLGTIFSFSSANDAASESACNMSYRKFEEKLMLSHGTVARGIKALKRLGAVTQDKSRRSGASYQCVNPPKETGVVTIEFYLYSTKFAVRGEKEARYLPKSAIDVLCLIKTHCANKRGCGYFVGSVRSIAGTLHLTKTTVQKAIDLLLGAKLVFRSQEGRGVNGHKRSRFTVNEKLLRRTEKNYRKETAPPTSEKRLSKAERAADERAERESYYATLQNRAQQRVKWFSDRLNQDSTYTKINAAVRALDISIARAELYKPSDVGRLQKEQRRLQIDRATRMAELNVSEADLVPKWRCTKCSDTGFFPNGKLCDCYLKGGRKP